MFKQFLDAAQHYRHADTNNRVLKSDVEALRAKVIDLSVSVTRKDETDLGGRLGDFHCDDHLAKLSENGKMH